MEQEVLSWKEKGRFLSIKGHDIFFLSEGNGSNLLILHGYPFNTYEWKFVWDKLLERYSITAFDFLGMGFSDKPTKHEYSYAEHCDTIVDILNHLNIQEVDILAHDLGVSVTQELIYRDSINKNDFHINSVAFLNGGLFMDVYKPRLIQKLLSKSPKPFGKLLSRIISKKSVNKSVKSVFGPNTQPNETLLNQLWEILNYKKGKRIAYLIGRLVFEKTKHQKKWINAMIKTQIPMCFINGPYDPNSGINMVNRYKELIPNPNVKLLSDNIGHWPQIEDPEGVLNAYFNFRDEIL